MCIRDRRDLGGRPASGDQPGGQRRAPCGLRSDRDGRRGPDPVSYTHLDVYKRQGQESADPNVVEVYVSYLRRKLGKARIETVRGVGYRMAP